MNRTGLQNLSRLRKREAATLLRARHYAGAYYLAGYAVECALKACLAKQTKKHDFPNKKLGTEAWTHDLQRLVQLAGLSAALDQGMKVNPALELNWSIVKDWSEAVRYELGITSAEARDLYSACTTRRNGVLAWIRERW